MAQHSGFFNALENGGTYDRKYNADDYTSNMAAIISTGVRKSGDDDLKVTASGLVVSVGVGRAWIDGRWYYNDTAYTLQTVTPPVGQLSRMDGVYLQANSNTAVRTIQLIYKTGTASSTPTAPACTRDGGIYEIMLATVLVNPNAESVTVTDKRADKTVCGWITTPIGYDDFFTSYDNEFNAWFDDVKDDLASVTLFKQYIWRGTTSGASTTQVTFSIPQYDSSGTDIINVFVNGLLEVPTTDYTLSGSTITFTNGKASGTEIVVICYKSIDGTGLGSISDELTALENQVSEFGDINDYYYFCNGSTDNVGISTVVQNFLNGSTTDGRTAKINIVGTFGQSGASAGSGTSASPYRWFNFTSSSATNRHITLDFTNCTPISIQPADNTYNYIFSGDNFTIKGLTMTFGNTTNTFDRNQGVVSSAKDFTFKDCSIKLMGNDNMGVTRFAECGTYINCTMTVINTQNSASVVWLTSIGKGYCRIEGGTYYAYTGQSLSSSNIIYTTSTYQNTAAIVIGASMPTKAITGMYQKKALELKYAYATIIGVTTELTIDTGTNANATVIGTIPLSL